VLETDEKGRVKLSMKALLDRPAREDRPEGENGGRGGRGDRGDRGPRRERDHDRAPQGDAPRDDAPAPGDA